MKPIKPIVVNIFYNKLKLIEDKGLVKRPNGINIRMVEVECFCGNKFITRFQGLKNGKVKSCGCVGKEKRSKRFTIHGLSETVEYTSWEGIKSRCMNSHNKFYKNYGGRGIKVCNEWLKFENFYRDMGNKPDKSYSIDRIDVNKDYYKENCTWSNRYTQDRNRTNSVYIEYKGELKNLCDLAKEVDMYQQTLRARLKRGLPVEEAIQKTFKYIKSGKYIKKDVILF